MSDKIRFGILGCSAIGEKSIIPAIMSANKAQLYMIGSRSNSKAKRFAKKFSCELNGNYEQVLENSKVDAVYISLPPSLHEKWIIKAAKSRKHIICEKPTSLSIKSAKKIVKECKNNHVQIIENFAFRVHPQQTRILELIKSNSIGVVNHFHGNYSFNLNSSKNNFRLNKKVGGGVLNDVSCYLINASRLIFNEKPTAVFCDLEYKNGIDIRGNIFIKYHDKTAACFFSYDDYFQSFYNIHGKNGIIQAERAFNVNKNMKSIINIKKNDKVKKITIKPADKFKILIDTFCNEIINFDSKKIDFENELVMQAKIIEAARRSTSLKKIIKI